MQAKIHFTKNNVLIDKIIVSCMLAFCIGFSIYKFELNPPFFSVVMSICILLILTSFLIKNEIILTKKSLTSCKKIKFLNQTYDCQKFMIEDISSIKYEPPKWVESSVKKTLLLFIPFYRSSWLAFSKKTNDHILHGDVPRLFIDLKSGNQVMLFTINNAQSNHEFIEKFDELKKTSANYRG